MSDPPNRPPHRRRDSLTAAAIRLLGGVVIALSIAAAVIRLIGQLQSSTTLGLDQLSEFLIFVLLGVACGGLLLGLSVVIRGLRGVHASMVRLEQSQSEPHRCPIIAEDWNKVAAATTKTLKESARSEHSATQDVESRKLMDVLQDIRDNLLLSAEERLQKRQRLAEEETHAARLLVDSLTRKGDFAQAREVAEAVRRKYATEQAALELVESVERAREQHEAEDVSTITREVADLISISAWERARKLTQQLLESHPDSAEARQLWLRVEREHRLFENEQRRRMNAEIQRFVNGRRWEQALAAARTFLARFPNCEDAEALRMQVPTLEANADIEVRQRLEAEIVEFARRGRYMEAAELARRIVEQYPESPQAQVLRAHLVRLEELARNPDAPPARVRSDE